MFSCSSESLDDAPKYNETIVGRWHLDGFEKNTMYIFDTEKRYTIYSDDGTFGGIEDAIPNPNSYTFENNNLLIDLNFGNTFKFGSFLRSFLVPFWVFRWLFSKIT